MAGAITHTPGNQTTHYMWATYRFETPLTGFNKPTTTNPEAGFVDGIASWNTTGSYYVWNRNYDPYLGRFTTPDPARSPDFNLQSYALNDPINFFDPEGLVPQSEKTAKEIVEELERRQNARNEAWERGERPDPVNNRDLQRERDGAGTIDVVHELQKEGHAHVLPFLEGADPNSVAGQSVRANSQAMMFLPDATLLLGGVGKLGSLARWGHRADHAADGFQASRQLRHADEAVDVARGGKVMDPKCFVSGTQVLTVDDSGNTVAKAIEGIEVGDMVWARDELSGDEGAKPVLTLFTNTTDILVHVTYTTGNSALSTATLTGTPGHPFWSVSRNAWVMMGDLRRDECLLLAGGQTATATYIRTEKLSSPVAVYNFEVADWHTYHVGTSQSGWVFVHNVCRIYVKRDPLGRPTAAVARIRPGDIGTGTGVTSAGRRAAQAAGSTGDDAGHLIARLLGGPGGKNAGNLVPMNARLNRGRFARFERRIADFVKAGNTAYLRVTPMYSGNSLRPNSIVYRARFTDGTEIVRTFRNRRQR